MGDTISKLKSGDLGGSLRRGIVSPYEAAPPLEIAQHTSMATTKPSYKKPPVTEVACGITFEPLRGFLLPYAGLFWDKIRKEYPITQHAPFINAPSPGWVDHATGIPLPRLWFLSEDKRRLIQLQGDCLVFNWRKSDGDIYPRFSNIFEDFRKIVSIFFAFLAELKFSDPVITACELSYVNLIPKGQGWETVEDIGNLMIDVRWDSTANRFLKSPTNLSWQAAFPLREEAGQLGVTLSQVQVLPQNTGAFRIDMVAKGAPKHPNLHAAWDWFDIGHEAIVCGFKDLTQPEIQREYWEIEND